MAFIFWARPKRSKQRGSRQLNEKLQSLGESLSRARQNLKPSKGPSKTVDIIPPISVEPESERKRRKCIEYWTAPAGGDLIHDKYARYVAEKHGNPTFATVNTGWKKMVELQTLITDKKTS